MNAGLTQRAQQVIDDGYYSVNSYFSSQFVPHM